jgi:hypothetical protein
MLCNQYKKVLTYSESLFATFKVYDMAKVSGLFLNEQQTILNGNNNTINKSENNDEHELKSLLKSNSSNGNQTSNNKSKSYSSESLKHSRKG